MASNRHDVTFPVRIFYNSESGEWWCEVYHAMNSKQSWDAGPYDCYEKCMQAAQTQIEVCFDTAFNCGNIYPNAPVIFSE